MVKIVSWIFTILYVLSGISLFLSSAWLLKRGIRNGIQNMSIVYVSLAMLVFTMGLRVFLI